MTISWLACVVLMLLAVASLFLLSGTGEAREPDDARIGPARRTGCKPPPRPPQTSTPVPRLSGPGCVPVPVVSP